VRVWDVEVREEVVLPVPSMLGGALSSLHHETEPGGGSRRFDTELSARDQAGQKKSIPGVGQHQVRQVLETRLANQRPSSPCRLLLSGSFPLEASAELVTLSVGNRKSRLRVKSGLESTGYKL